jgi:hypothetical protein
MSDVGSSVDKVTETSDQAPILCCINDVAIVHILELQMLLHGCAAGVAVSQACTLQNLPSISWLRQSDLPLPLLHLNPQVITQEAEVAHLEHLLHLGLELDDLTSFAPCDDKIINIDADKQVRVSVAMTVDAMFE